MSVRLLLQSPRGERASAATAERRGSIRIKVTDLIGMLAQAGRRALRRRAAPRPGAPIAVPGLLTVLLGLVLAIWLAKLFPRGQTVRHRLRCTRKQFEAALALLPLALKLLSNPIVRDYLRRTVIRQISRKLGR